MAWGNFGAKGGALGGVLRMYTILSPCGTPIAGDGFAINTSFVGNNKH